jgi:hypothetical protein
MIRAGRNLRRPACPYVWLICSLASALLSPATFAAAASADSRLPEIVGLRVGFDGYFKLGAWTPLEVTLRGGSEAAAGQLSMIVPDGDNAPSRVMSPPDQPIQLSTGQTSRATLYAKLGREPQSLVVVFQAHGLPEVRRSFDARSDDQDAGRALALGSDEKLMLTLGQSIAPVGNVEGAPPSRWVNIADFDRLPARWYGYEGVDLLILGINSPEAAANLRRANEQLDGIDQWLRLGGRMLLAVGAEAPQVLAPDAPLARFAPGTFDKVETLRRAPGLEAFSRSSHRIPPRGRGDAIDLAVTRLQSVTGVVLLEEAGLPLIVETPRAFGEITLLAFDPSRPPIADWQGRGPLVERLVSGGKPTANYETLPALQAQASRVGLSDLAGQLRGALDQFSGRLIPFWVVALLILGYIALIGPLDYFLVKKVFKNMQLTWVTFPTIVLGVSLGAYLLAGSIKGDRLQLNQVDLVDVDARSGLVRGTTWLNVFSPTTSSYDLSLRVRLQGATDKPSDEVLFSWLGLPGSAWGGMQSATGPGVFARPYDFAPGLDRLRGVTIDVWSTKSFTARWRDHWSSPVPSQLKASGDQGLHGSVTNPLSTTLSRGLLLYGRWAYSLGNVSPGGSAEIRPGEQSDLPTILKGFQQVHHEKTNSFVRQAVPYNAWGFDVANILQFMMFYQAAGGLGYTGLANEYQNFVDLSSHLQMHEAILLGQVEGPAPTELMRGDPAFGNDRPIGGSEDRNWTFYRFLLPVEQTE